MSNTQLVVENLTIGYDGKRLAGPWSFDMRSGGLHVIQGPNGCGKSTLARTLLGLIPAVGGRVSFDPAGASSWVPQYLPMADDLPVSVYEVVEMGLWARDRKGKRTIGGRPGGYSKADRRTLVAEALETVGLSGSEAKRFAHLSGGQQRRALLARALVQRARFVVLDEPLAGVDVEGRRALGDLLSKLAQERDRLFLVITHDIDWLSEPPQSVATIEADGIVRQELA